MKTKIFLLFNLIIMNVSAQVPNWQWAKNAGNGFLDAASSCATDASGNVYVVGYFDGGVINFGGTPLFSAGSGKDMYIVKYNSTGTMQWAKSAGGNKDAKAISVATDAAGNIFVTGTFVSTTITFGTDTLTNTGSINTEDVFVVKYDPTGKVLWANSATGNSNDYVASVAIDANGNAVITGHFRSPTISFGAISLTNAATQGDIFLVKYSPTGTVIWANNYGGNSDDEGLCVTTDGSGNVILTGVYASPAINFGVLTLTNIDNTGGTGDLFLAKFSSTGAAVWAKTGGGISTDLAYSVSTDNSGNIFISGNFQAPTIVLGSFSLTNADAGGNTADIFFAKYDASGNALWAKRFGGTSFDRTYSRAPTDPAGNVYLSGQSNSPTIVIGATTLVHVGSLGDEDIFTGKFDTNGNNIWVKNLAGLASDWSRCVATDLLGNAYLCGSFKSKTLAFDSLTLNNTGGSFQMFVGKLGSLTPVTTASVTNVNCNGQCTATATAIASGGSGGYTYSWNTIPPQTTQIVTGICAGTYTVTVTDASGIITTTGVTISQPPVISATISSQTNVNCNGGSTGSATALASGGGGTYIYVWQPGNLSGATQSNLSASTYTINITDDKNCSLTTTVSITQPATPISALASFTPSTCGNNDATASVTAAGGTGSYTYSWTPTGGTGATATNLSSGNYVVIVTDANNCAASSTVLVGSTGGITVALTSQFDVLCNGENTGSSSVNATGGTGPYTYSWIPSGGTNSTATNLIAGSYTVVVKDASGCLSQQTVSITQPAQLSVIPSVTNTPCGSITGKITTIVTGGTGTYSYSWTQGAQNNSSISNLAAGQYSLTVTDANGCTISTASMVSTIGSLSPTISPSTSILFSGDSVQLSATGGITYSWSPTTNLSCTSCANPFASPLTTTTYVVMATDTNGCTGTQSVTINIEIKCGELFFPTIFSPNGNGPSINERQCVSGNCIQTIYWAVYDRWGEKVFDTSSQNDCWDGTYKDKAMDTGVFIYKLEATLMDGRTVSKTGNLTLIR